MPIITLTSDWGYKDHYIGAVKGAILHRMPDATIVDISHSIPPFNVEHAAFVLKNCYHNYPEGTVHIIGVNTEESDKNPHTIIKIDGQFFISADTGIFSMIFNKKPDKIIELTIVQDSGFFTFSTRDRFAKAAVHIAQGKNIDELGDTKDSINEKILFEPVVTESLIKGHVIFIDSYENIITNIKEPLFKEVGKGQKFTIGFRTYEIHKISRSYSDVPVGEIVALFNSGGYLEIAMNQGNAAGLLGMDSKDLVRIEFGE